MKILIIEDDQVIAHGISTVLNKWQYTCLICQKFNKILEEFIKFEPQLVLLDINLPYYDGFFWCQEIRKISKVPILIISSREDDKDKIRAITLGADDFIEKPFENEFLMAKVEALLRRTYDYASETQHIKCFEDYRLNLSTNLLSNKDLSVKLTNNETLILWILASADGSIVSREYLMQKLWDDAKFVDENTLNVNITRLRKKIKSLNEEDLIETIKGEGYQLL